MDDHLLIHQKNPLVCELNISFNRKPLQGEFTILISSPEKDTLKIGFDPASNRYFIDRVKAGISDFNKSLIPFTEGITFAIVESFSKIILSTQICLASPPLVIG